MDIEQFYDQDARRRESDEVELGRDWTDAAGIRTEISWVVDTGEVYAMREPGAVDIDMFGDVMAEKVSSDAIIVAVLGVVATREELNRKLAGWETAMREPNSVSWVRDRLATPPT